MDSEKICQTLREMVPAGVCVAAGPALKTSLTERERASLGDADVSRISEFESGRAYAKRALAMLGEHNVDLPIGADHAPLWPADVVGSITHIQNSPGSTYAAAAVARADAIFALGIDFETEHSLQPRIWQHVLTQQELERILALPVGARSAEAQFLWCAKEATAKIIKEPFDPCGIEVDRDRTNGEFMVTFTNNDRRYLPNGLQGRTACLDGLFIATAVLS
jgi:4'-phosphopantetheinyl transferase EntD